ncbi:hypothetical protein WDU94_003989 [Cyamophila willieti]
MMDICEEPLLLSSTFSIPVNTNSSSDFLTPEDSSFFLSDTDLNLTSSSVIQFTSLQVSPRSEIFQYHSLTPPAEELCHDLLSPLFGITSLDTADDDIEEIGNSPHGPTIQEETISESAIRTPRSLPVGIDFSPKIIVEDITERLLSISGSLLTNLESPATSITNQFESVPQSLNGRTKDLNSGSVTNDPIVTAKTKRSARRTKKTRNSRKVEKKKPLSTKRSTENIELKDSALTGEENVLCNGIEANSNLSCNDIEPANISCNGIEANSNLSCNDIESANISCNGIEENSNLSCNDIEPANISCNGIEDNSNISCNDIETENISCNGIETNDVSCNGSDTVNVSYNETETTDSPSKAELDNLEPPPAKRRRKYKPRKHIPKTLNLRGRPRKVPVLVTKLSFDPVHEFTRSLSPYKWALNNYNPQDILEYRELLDSNNLQHCFSLSFDD